MSHAAEPGRGRLMLLGPAAWQPGDQGPEPLAPERPYQVLAWLGHHGEWVGRERLATLLWPDHAPAAARRNLRKVLFRTRELPGLPPVQERGSMLRWPVDCDVRELEAATEAGRWAEAAALWRGEPWQGLQAEDLGELGAWLAFERERLRARWRLAVLQLAEAARAQSDSAAVQAWTQRLLAADPDDDAALALRVQARPVEAVARVATPHTEPGAAMAEDFIGRRAELAELRDTLADPACRWLTIVGPGGIGKTRLLGQALADAVPSGVATLLVAYPDLVDDVADAQAPGAVEHLGRRLADRLGLILDSDTPLAEQLRRQLTGRRLRIGLDNLELVPRAAHALAAVLAGIAGVQVVATSRVRLGLPGERLLLLQGLPWPSAEDADRAEAFDAVQLFARRARAHRPGFDLAAEAPAVGALCAAVEGLPLALELAAVWARHFGAAEILAELQSGAGALLADAGDGALDQPARQRGMRACFDHSFRRLARAEQRVLEGVSVLRGSFSLEAARQVADATLPRLATLIDASLLRRADAPEAGRRFSMHPLIRQFAAERLASDPAQEAAVLDRMATHYLRLLAATPPPGRPRERRRALDALAGEAENLLAAWERACQTGRAELLAPALPALRALQHLRARWAEGLALLDRADASWGHDAGARAQAALSRAQHDYALGRFQAAVQRAEAQLAHWRSEGDGVALREALMIAGHGRLHLGDYDASTRLLEDGLASAREDDDLGDVAAFLNALAQLDFHHGRFARCSERGREAVRFLRITGGDPSTVLGKLSMNLMADGRLDEALQALDEALSGCPPQAHRHRHVTLLLCTGPVHCRRRDWPAAEAQIARAEALLDTEQPPARLHYFVELLRVRVAAGRGQATVALERLVALTEFCLGWGSRPAQATLAADWGRWFMAHRDEARGRRLLQAVLACPDLDAGERHLVQAALGPDAAVALSPQPAADLLRSALSTLAVSHPATA